MLGLLYKDFIAVKGKNLLVFLLAQFGVFTLLRFMITGDAIVDSILVAILFPIYGVFSVMVVSQCALSIIKSDEGKKQKQYYLSLPISKKQYVASKYLFIAIAFYILQSTFIFQLQVCSVNLISDQAASQVSVIQSIIPVLFSVAMVISALDLIFYFGLGVARAKNAINGLFFLLLFVVMTFFLFGDLSLIENFNLVAIMDYLQKHYEIMLAVQVLAPVAALVMYYGCYRISVKLFERREWEDE